MCAAGQAAANGAHHVLLLGGLEDVVVLDVFAGRLGSVIALGADRFKAFVEQVELELGRAQHAHLAFRDTRELLAQNRARRMRDVVMMMVEHVAEHERGALDPRNAAQCAHVGLQHEIAVALLPGGGLEARHGLHVHVHGEQVVAGVPFLVHRIEEEPARDPLADQPALHVGERGDHRVDLATGHQRLELRLVQSARHASGLVRSG